MITIVVYTSSLNLSFTLSLCLIFCSLTSHFLHYSHIMTTFLDNFRATTRPFVFIFCTKTRPLDGNFRATTRPFVFIFCTKTRPLDGNFRATTRPLVDDFLHDDTSLSSNSTPQDVYLLTNLRNESSSGWHFAWRLVTLRLIQRLIQRHKTPFSRQFAHWVDHLLTFLHDKSSLYV